MFGLPKEEGIFVSGEGGWEVVCAEGSAGGGGGCGKGCWGRWRRFGGFNIDFLELGGVFHA